MRVLVLFKATADSEAGVLPSTDLLEMEDFGDEFRPELREQEERLREELDGR